MSEMMNKALIYYLQKFVTIPLEDRAFIVSAFSIESLKPRTMFQPGVKGLNKLYFVEEGLIKLVVERPGFEDSVFSFVEGFEIVGISSLYPSTDQSPLSLMTISDTIVWSIEMHKFEELCASYDYLKHAVSEAIKHSIAETISIKSAYLGLTAYEKYVKLIEIQPHIVLNAPLKDIASYLEITPQSISRVRRKVSSGDALKLKKIA